uniref:Uncharacterized protein n=1 Tax=Rhizophora mucronata TaxID=61149 RepID=A0A2P2NLP0_RHIMU
MSRSVCFQLLGLRLLFKFCLLGCFFFVGFIFFLGVRIEAGRSCFPGTTPFSGFMILSISATRDVLFICF